MRAYQSESITELAKALIQVQRDLQPAVKDATNTFMQNRYASFNCVMETCREALLSNGIWLCQYPVQVDADSSGFCMGLVTKLTHAESGQWQASLAVVPLPKADPQGYGSCITYAKRYALTAMLGIVTEDDDGEGAATAPKQPSTARRARNTPLEQKVPSDVATQALSAQNAVKPPSERGAFSSLPHIDGINYQSVIAQDGRTCIIATGHTQPKKELLLGAGFRWNAQRKMWWKYADAS